MNLPKLQKGEKKTKNDSKIVAIFNFFCLTNCNVDRCFDCSRKKTHQNYFGYGKMKKKTIKT